MQSSSVFSFGFVAVLATCAGLAACGGGDGATDGADASLGGSGGSTSATGGGSNSEEFVDHPGQIRFANFLSDGEEGIVVDVYWGGTTESGELAATIEYGEITEFVTPRRWTRAIGDEEEVVFTFYPEGELEFGDMLLRLEEDMFEDTKLTIGLSAARRYESETEYRISTTMFVENELGTPPAGFAHVYGWSHPFENVPEGDFVQVGTDDTCDFEAGEVTGGNLGVPRLVPDGTSGLRFFDANTECTAGSTTADGAVEEGKSYVLIGEALTYELEARNAVLLEIGAN